MKKILGLLIFSLLVCDIANAAIDLPRDASGWTILTPSTGSKIVYLAAAPTGDDDTCVAYAPSSELIGADPFNPAGDVLECETFAKAISLTRNAYPDWILARRGDTFYSGALINKNGFSSSEPFVFASYGSTGAMPIFKTGESSGLDIGYKNNIVVSGLDFYANGRDPNSGEYTGASTAPYGFTLHGSTAPAATMNNITVEGCRFRFFYNGGGVRGYDNANGIVIRRNSILDSYTNGDGNAQGMLYNGTNSEAIVEENVIDHNGYLIVSNGDANNDPGEATPLRHSFYAGGNTDITIRKNINSRSSSIAWKFAGYSPILNPPGDKAQVNTIIDNNLVLDCPVGVSMWGEDTDDYLHYTNVSITNNVFSNLGLSNQSSQEIAWGIDLANISTGLVKNNIVMNQTSIEISNGPHALNFRGKLNNITVADNVFHDLYYTYIFQPTDDGAHVPAFGSITITGNKINVPTNSNYIVYDYYNLLDSFSFSNNQYYTTGADGTRFRVANVAKTDAQWVALTGDDSTFSQPTFPESTRSIETYMASLGETATLDAFIAKARAQDRYNWDTRFTADAVNDYLRAGFGVSKYTPPGQARRLSLAGRPIKLVEPGP